jgi:hypothetical protein
MGGDGKLIELCPKRQVVPPIRGLAFDAIGKELGMSKVAVLK